MHKISVKLGLGFFCYYLDMYTFFFFFSFMHCFCCSFQNPVCNYIYCGTQWFEYLQFSGIFVFNLDAAGGRTSNLPLFCFCWNSRCCDFLF